MMRMKGQIPEGKKQRSSFKSAKLWEITFYTLVEFICNKRRLKSANMNKTLHFYSDANFDELYKTILFSAD